MGLEGAVELERPCVCDCLLSTLAQRWDSKQHIDTVREKREQHSLHLKIFMRGCQRGYTKLKHGKVQIL